ASSDPVARHIHPSTFQTKELPMQIRDIAAIVTGGASGLGGATADMLVALGARVSIFDLNEEQGASKAEEIGARFFRADVVDAGSVTSALDAAQDAHGPARILVNCAGIAPAIKTVGRDNIPHPFDAFR